MNCEQYQTGLNNLQSLLCSLGGIIDIAIGVVGSLGLLAFFWGLAKFIFHAGDKEAIEGGKRIMIWGIVALFVMFSIWGIITFMQIALIGPQ